MSLLLFAALFAQLSNGLTQEMYDILKEFDPEDPYNDSYIGRMHKVIFSLSTKNDTLTWDNPEMDEPERPPERDVIELTS